GGGGYSDAMGTTRLSAFSILPARIARVGLAAVIGAGSLLAALLGGAWSAPTALAYSACQSSTASLWDGTNGLGLSTWGASAWINTRNAGFCTGNDPAGNKDTISAWSMVTDRQVANYAQAGYMRYRDQSNYHLFAEYTDTNCPSGYCHVDSPTLTYPSDNTQYWEVYSTDSDKIEMWASNSAIGNLRITWTGYDPTVSGSNHWDGPWNEQYNGETHNAGSDVPGSLDYKTSFTSVAYFPGSPWNGEQFPPGFSDVNDYPQPSGSKDYYCSQNGVPSEFNIWVHGTPCNG
ncbi:MAG TPA: hypothetical protein VFB34_00810, partial [Chloroflexota bacterium]|nr:hypothetical protein [Chloroflexota bacterium]